MALEASCGLKNHEAGRAEALRPAFAGRRKVYARPAATRAYKMNVLSCFSFSKLQSPNDEQSALEWVGIRGDITLGIGRGHTDLFNAEWETVVLTQQRYTPSCIDLSLYYHKQVMLSH